MKTDLALEQFLSSLENETTRINYEIVLKDFLSNLTLVVQVTKEAIQQYKEILSEKDASPQTIAARLAAIRSFCDFCWNSGWLQSNPGLYIKNDHVEKYGQAKNITMEDFKKFLGQIDTKTLIGTRDLLLIRLIFFYGDPEKILAIPFSQDLPAQFEPLKQTYIQELSKVTKIPKLSYGFLFFDGEGLDNSKPLSLSGTRKVLIKYAMKAGFPHTYVDFQALKRLRAKQIYQQTESAEAVQAFCGHKSLKITKAYIKTLA